ncbi:protein CURLY FLAG LEAF 1-like [Malania oleifera]|uniref:protein CURLY FLAG LEAF 1-like n=1 Tax=Malania oleifera TaxID=397392 RepID=UPI0025AE78BE|nr:protein CURLY FLAG LEAF 1-like [Malania oleifera]
MVSLQTPLSPNRRKAITEFDNLLTKKRKWEEPAAEARQSIFVKPFNVKDKSTSTSILDMELQLQETPLPSEWQRCLDIQSGQIHFYNTRTHKRTSRDPRRSPEPTESGDDHMSLDLELNLPCGPMKKSHADQEAGINNKHMPYDSSHSSTTITTDLLMNLDQHKNNSCRSPTGSPLPWLSTERDQEDMVTAVCMQCHMLVMLCKTSPICPNCKFMHPPNQSPPNQLKPRFSFLC